MIDTRLVVEELLVQIHISAFRTDFEKYSSGNHKEWCFYFLPLYLLFERTVKTRELNLHYLFVTMFSCPQQMLQTCDTITTSMIISKNRPSFKLSICGLYWLPLKILPLPPLACIPCCSRSTLPRDWLERRWNKYEARLFFLIQPIRSLILAWLSSLLNRPIHRTRTAAKRTKKKNANAKRGKLLVLVVKYANLWRSCLSFLLTQAT